MSEYAIHVDWSNENSFERWRNVGQEVMREFYEENPKEAERDGHDVEKDEGEITIKYLDEVLYGWQPMMNYAYPLNTRPSDDEVIKVCRETCLTVMEDTEDWDGKYYLALCGGGMDLSQSVAYAYQIIENWVPISLLIEVSKQPELSIYGTKWLKMARQLRKQLLMDISNLEMSRRQWGQAIKDYNNKHKKNKGE